MLLLVYNYISRKLKINLQMRNMLFFFFSILSGALSAEVSLPSPKIDNPNISPVEVSGFWGQFFHDFTFIPAGIILMVIIAFIIFRLSKGKYGAKIRQFFKRFELDDNHGVA
ncbi:MAG: hypothetical protein NT165_01075 [Candidatus Falkowbacteria bacterium]|nr:hypothetical protein [Candidatus Falkowbacteria bacterium]